MITSRTNNRIKNIRKLLESGKNRKEQGLFVAEGERIVSEIPPEMIRALFVSESRYRQIQKDANDDNNAVLQMILKEEAEIVSDEVFKSLSDTVNPQGMLALVQMPEHTLSDLTGNTDPKKRHVLVILDDLQDPGNLGTILRTSEAAGAEGIILSPGCVDIFNPKVVRSTMGSIFRVPFVTAQLSEAIGSLKENGYEIYGTSLEASLPYKEVDYGNRIAFVVGNEGSGIRKEVLTQTTANLIIPMKGNVESLNAAVSLAVLLFHIM